MKRLLKVALSLWLLVGLCSITARATEPSVLMPEPDYGWYENTTGSTYYLNDVEDLYGFANIVNGTTGNDIEKDSFLGKTVVLCADINLAGYYWTPIGSSMYDHTATDAATKKFEGTFDGGNHVISNLRSAGYKPLEADAGNSNEYSYGLFGYAYGADVKNVKLANVAIDCCTISLPGRNIDGSGVAALIGFYVPKNGVASVIENCHVLSGTVVASNNMGGLMGFMQSMEEGDAVDVTIKGCTNNAAVTTRMREAGGILGLVQIKNANFVPGCVKFVDCTNTGNITAEAGANPSIAGGILGQENTSDYHMAYGTLQVIFSNCVNRGTITAISKGGGEVFASGMGTVQYSNGAWLVGIDCANYGDIIITNNDGDLMAGEIFALGSFLTLDNCKTYGKVTVLGTEMLGCQVGRVYQNIWLDNMSDVLVSNQSNANPVVYLLNGGETLTPRTYDRQTGNVSNPDPTREGYEFVGWETVTGAAIEFVYDAVYSALWSAGSYSVNFDPNGGVGVPMGPIEFNYDREDQSLPLNAGYTNYTRENYYFNGWNTAADGSGTSFADGMAKPNVSGVSGAAITLYAQWAGNQYAINYAGMEGATPGSDYPLIHTYGTATAISDPTKTGYTFDGWQINQESGLIKSLTLDATAYTEAITLTANWTLLEAEGSDPGTVRPELPYYPYFPYIPEVEPEETVPEFSDVDPDAYYYEAVQWAVKNGIVTGTSEDTFGAKEKFSRAQAIMALWLAAGAPEPTGTEMAFEDVDADAEYYKAVLWAVENGITTGKTETTFGPDAKCTRAQFVTFLWRAEKSPEAEVENTFKDMKAGAYYTEAVQWAAQEEITTGTSEDKFSPNKNCSKAQIVTFLYRCLGEK